MFRRDVFRGGVCSSGAKPHRWQQSLLGSALWLAMSLPCLAQPAPPAQEQAEVSPRVARLIRDLGADSFVDRQRANGELQRLGGSIRKQLEQAAESPDIEVQQHALALLRQIKLADIWLPSRVTAEARQIPTTAALDILAQQTGNRVLVGDQYGQYQDALVDLDLNDVPYWQALDALCRSGGNHIRPHFDTRMPGMVLTLGESWRAPVAYSGPVRARITGARRTFHEELNYETQKSDVRHAFHFNVQMMWEDRFRLVAYRSHPELIEAITASGLPLASTQPAPNTWHVAGGGTRELSMTLHLQPPAVTENTLKTLRLRWGLIAIGEMESLELKELREQATVARDDAELLVEAFRQKEQGQYEMTLRLIRDLPIPQPKDLMFQENELELLDEQGTPFRRQTLSNSLTETGLVYKLSFSGDHPQAQAKVLRWTYPRLRAQNELEIEFRDVPLPEARPE